MALAGHDTAYLVINDPATAGVYSGTFNGVVAGERIVVAVAADGNSNAQDPSTWNVTLGSDTLSHVVSNTTSLVQGFTAIFAGTATASGNLTLTVDPVNQTRALTAHAFRITGFNTTTPHPNSGQNMPGSNATSLTSPNAVTTAANGNAIIGVISVHGGDITGLAVGAADGSTTGNNGGSAFNDNTWGVAWDRTPTAASVTFAWTWTGSDRPGASWIEIAEAAGALTVNVPAGSYTLTGHAPTITRHLVATVAAGSYALTGYTPTLTVSANVNVPPGSYALTGYAPQLVRALRVDAPAGAYSLTGFAPSISVAGTIDVPAGSYSLAGYAPVIHKPVGSDATWIGAWATWGALGATWTPAAVISVDLGGYTLTGFAPAVTRSLMASVQAGSYTLAGFAPTITAARLISVPAGNYNLTGHAPALVTVGTISVDLGTYSLTGFAPTVLRSLRLDVPVGVYSLTGHAPTLNTSARIDVPVGSYALTGHAPEVRRSLILSVPSGTYTFSGHAPSISSAPPAPRRVALASESRNGVIILTPANGAVVAREVIGANDVLDMSGHPITDMSNSALLGMTG